MTPPPFNYNRESKNRWLGRECQSALLCVDLIALMKYLKMLEGLLSLASIVEETARELCVSKSL